MDKELIANGKKKTLKPETLMMGYAYKPEWSEGAVKCPIFQTSTFVFKNAWPASAPAVRWSSSV